MDFRTCYDTPCTVDLRLETGYPLAESNDKHAKLNEAELSGALEAPPIDESLTSEYGAFWKCVQAGGIYVFTQLVKMLAFATFFPTADSVGQDGFDIIGEFLKSTIDLADLVGISLVLNGIPGKGHAKVLTAGIGWAGAEVLLTRFLLLWIGARGAEFDWKYIQKSLESNISLVQHITTATLVWLWSRHDLRRGLLPIVVSMLLLTVYRSLILDFLSSLLLAGPWSSLFIKAVTTLFMGATTLHIYAGLAHSIGIF